MALAEISVVNNEIVIEVSGTALLAPLVSAAAAYVSEAEDARDAAEGFRDDAAAEAAALVAVTDKVDAGLSQVTVLDPAGLTSTSVVTTAGNSFLYTGNSYGGWGVAFDAPATFTTDGFILGRIKREAGLDPEDQIASVLVVMRTAASNVHNAGTTVVAIGRPTILKADEDLLDVAGLWMDPSDGVTPITVTEADTDARILLAYQGLKSDGDGANSVGLQYATARDVTLANASVYRVPSTYDLLTDAVISWSAGDVAISLVSFDGASETLETVISLTTSRATGLPPGNIVNPTPYELILAPRWFGVQGVTGRIQNWGACAAATRQNIRYGTSNGYGRTRDDRWSWDSDIGISFGNYSLPVSVRDPDFETERAAGTQVIKVVTPTAAAAKAVGLVCMGDSFTNTAVYTQQLLTRKAAYTSGVQPTLIGTKGTGANLHEGRDGWTLLNYYSSASAGTDTNAFQGPSGKFDATFWQTDNSLTIPDAVFMQLGTNDVFAATSDLQVHLIMSRYIGMMRQIIGLDADADVGSWKELNADIVVMLATPAPPAATQDGFGLVHYTNGQTMWRYKRNAAIAAKRIIAAFSGLESDKVFICPWHTAVDAVGGFNGTTDGIHPSTGTGYPQLGDQLWAMMNVLAVEGEFE
jgi:lysophospholipase L1-like esterase